MAFLLHLLRWVTRTRGDGQFGPMVFLLLAVLSLGSLLVIYYDNQNIILAILMSVAALCALDPVTPWALQVIYSVAKRVEYG